jgi:hypothetical protein
MLSRGRSLLANAGRSERLVDQSVTTRLIDSTSSFSSFFRCKQNLLTAFDPDPRQPQDFQMASFFAGDREIPGSAKVDQ